MISRRAIARTVRTRGSGADRFLSSVSASEQSGCPVTGPILKKVPSLPLVGSMIPQHSGVPLFEFTRQYEFNNEFRKTFGNFIRSGIPGMGSGTHGIMYTIYDPIEMAKVVRSEGAHPSGLVEKIWQWRRAMLDSGSALVSKKDSGEYDYGLFDHGESWKRQRTFLQTGMLDPVAAKGFLPGIVSAAENASRVAPLHSNDVNEYLNYTAFDMFCSFMFGRQMLTTSSTVSSDPTVKEENAENERFVKAALGVFDKTNDINLMPTEIILGMYLPFFKTKKFKALQKDWDTVREIGLKKIHDFIDRYDRNELDDMEKKSYLAGAIERQRSSNEVSQEEMVDLCIVALFVGVDTTSSVTGWNLMHLALNPESQEKLHTELVGSLKAKGSNQGTTVNADVLAKKASPYLHLCLRESHRITPAFTAAMWKGNSQRDVDIHGEKIPKGSMIQMGHISYDDEYLENPKEFRPERWTAEGVTSRKGTKSEVLDHPFLRDPFSQGARRCPGSRVAVNEIQAMIAQLVLDWKISIPDESINSLDDIGHDTSPISPVFPTMKFEARE